MKKLILLAVILIGILAFSNVNAQGDDATPKHSYITFRVNVNPPVFNGNNFYGSWGTINFTATVETNTGPETFNGSTNYYAGQVSYDFVRLVQGDITQVSLTGYAAVYWVIHKFDCIFYYTHGGSGSITLYPPQTGNVYTVNVSSFTPIYWDSSCSSPVDPPQQ